ncbi:hypothetical protein [Streptomyces sp. MST-110588]|uniref:hypothetical protein n=1 Tax=Streptomyces sp. MST-110588 TaxID=2833628 RepID=UPI001F5D3BEA|nr:hypothetical protein [Streptomyces sp. MST-110588]UNO42458.1 hypothetical protein KGS77_26705 [Streptomyces sp. MST-110588]
MEQQQATAPRPERPCPVDVIDVEQAEAALIDHYPRLVRLAYLVLSPEPGRNRRVLRAHAVVQRSLPRRRTTTRGPGLPLCGEDSQQTSDPVYAFVRARVLRSALTAERPWWRLSMVRRGLPLAPLPPVLPQVWGLRLFPRSGGADELVLDRTLSGLSGPGRAAFVLRELERLDEKDTRAALEAAGVEDTREAVAEAAGHTPPAGTKDRSLLESAEFDPCSLLARPTDLLRRRQHGRAALAAGAAVLVCGALLGLPGDGWGPDGAAAPPYAQNSAAQAALDPARLSAAAPGAWLKSTRRDFSTWPVRGDRAGDKELLRRALAVWARPGTGVQVSAAPGTAPGPAAGPAQLLFAGVVDRAAVVLLYDGLRVVRYAEAADGDSGRDGDIGAALDFARTDSADADSSGALVLGRTDGNVRYLTAPWVKGVTMTDLLKPAGQGLPLHVGKDGMTDPVPSPAAAKNCDSWPALRMDGHLLTDLGELTAVRLTYGEPGKARDVRSAEARTAWARTACHLATMRGQGVREVNDWTFAQQSLPGGAGRAAWVCTRVETWRDRGSRALAQIQTPPRKPAGKPAGASAPRRPAGARPGAKAGAPGAAQPFAPGAVVARSEDGAACGERDPRALAGVLWRSADHKWWLLAAGSPQVSRISASGGVKGQSRSRLLAVPAKPGVHAELQGRLKNGKRLAALH